MLNPKNAERSFVMLKPDAIHRKLAGEIISRIERRGFKMVACRLTMASKDLLQRHYADLAAKPFFPDLVRYMSSGPVLPMVWEGLGVVATVRGLLGATNPKDSLPGTIRGDFCIDVGRNIIHASDSVGAAEKEIGLWFGGGGVYGWRASETQWIYEDEEEESKEVAQKKTQQNSAKKVRLNGSEAQVKTLAARIFFIQKAALLKSFWVYLFTNPLLTLN